MRMTTGADENREASDYKMRNFAYTVLLAYLSFGPCTQTSAQSAQQVKTPSLQETLDWLKEKVPLATANYKQIYFLNNKKQVDDVNTVATVMDMSSCNVILGHISNSTLETESDLNTSKIEARYTLNLGSLVFGSAERIKERDMENGVRVVSTTSEPLYGLSLYSSAYDISLSLRVLHSTFPEKKNAMDHMNLWFNNKELAERIEKGFLHAAELCRAIQPNEPF